MQKQHLKIANKRKDFLHKVSKQLSDKYNVVIVEDLKIKNMSKSAKGDENKHGKNVAQKSGLNRSILNQSWGMFFTMLEYKLISKGGRFEKIDPRYTSQECPMCNSIAKENRESQSVFHCKSCHYEAMADYVASVNIKNRWINGDCLSSSRLKSVEQEALAL